MHVDSQVGIGSEHVERMRIVPSGKYAADDGSRGCLPQGQ